MASVQGASSSPLRLFVDKARNRVVVGEASGDFIDALLSFLTLPLGTIIRLLSNEETQRSAEVGCINKLYHSVQNFNTEVLWNEICKKMLLCPRNPCEKLCQKLRFNVDDTEPTKYLMCGSCRVIKKYETNWLSTFPGASCSTCGKLMDKEMKLEGEGDYNSKGDGVFVRGKSMYLIFDDLTVLQNSARNTIHQLIQLGYTDFTNLTEIFPDVALHQIMDLLKHAFISTFPLTELFLAREDVGSKTVSSYTPVLASQNVYGSDSSYNLQITASKSKNKILYAEAEEDFVDFLLSFLTMPLGSTIKLLEGNVNLGSMHNLYKSVRGLNPHTSSFPSPLLDLKVASQYGCKMQLLDIREKQSPSYYCGLNNNGVISKCYDVEKSACRLELLDPRCADGRREAAVGKKKNKKRRREAAMGFVRRPALFVVTDDLQVLPLASASTISFLHKLNIPFDDLEEHEVKIGKMEAMNLLGASLTSKAALTDGLFYLVNKPKEKAED